MNDLKGVSEYLSIVDKELTSVNVDLTTCQQSIAEIVSQIEMKKVEKAHLDAQLFLRNKKEEIDDDTWLEMSIKERFEALKPKKYADEDLSEKHLVSSLRELQEQEKLLLDDEVNLSKLQERLNKLNDLIRTSENLNHKAFEIHDFNIQLIMTPQSIPDNHLDLWIKILEKHPDVTLEFFDAMQDSTVKAGSVFKHAFFTYEETCVNILSTFKKPADIRAGLFVYDRFYKSIESILEGKAKPSSQYSKVYESIKAIEKHGKYENIQYEIDLATSLQQDLNRLENETDPNKQQNYKMIFETRLHSLDDKMSENHDAWVVKKFKKLVELVAFALEYTWASITGASQKPSLGDKPKKTERQKRVDLVDTFFKAADSSNVKEKTVPVNVPVNVEDNKIIVWELRSESPQGSSPIVTPQVV